MKLAHYVEKKMNWRIDESIDTPENKINDFTVQRITELLKKRRNLKMEIERAKNIKNKDKIDKMVGEYLKCTCDIILLKESMRWIGI